MKTRTRSAAAHSGLSRRTFLRLGALAGAAAVFPPLRQIAAQSPYQGRPNLPHSAAQGQQRVLILGAGLAGLTAAYELSRAGYACLILEADSRAGGRILTIRRDSTITETGREPQTSTFDEGLFFNAGADRIPGTHRGVLSYCREFGVPVHPFVSLNTAAYFYNENVGRLSGERIRLGQAWIDFLGYVTSGLAKAIDAGHLNEDLPEDLHELMLDYLGVYGDLQDDHSYTGSNKAGYTELPGAFDTPGTPQEPLEFEALLQTEYWRYFPFDWPLYQQLALLQVVGGMDRLIAAFTERLTDSIRYGSQVQAIRRTEQGVRVTYTETASGTDAEETADYCLCTLPLPIVAELATEFPDSVQEAIRAIQYEAVTKVGLQFNRRFWEDEDYIYGGGSFTNLSIGQIWYPSHNYHAPKGILTGAYTIGELARTLGDLPPDARIQEALAQGAKLHPQYEDAFEQGVSVAWHQMPFARGAWAGYTEEQREMFYPRLLDFDERIVLAGDHMSYLNGWMEGAVLSAHHAVERIGARVQAG